MTPLVLMALVCTFGAVALTVGMVTTLVFERVRPHAEAVGVLADGDGPSDAGPLITEHHPLVERLATAVPRSPAQLSLLGRRLTRAGYRTRTAVALYTAAQLLVPVLLGGAALLFLHRPWSLWFTLMGLLFGAVLPSLVLGRLVATRQRAIGNGLPDALDLMVVCLEAGSSVDQAILRVSDELQLAHPALSEELRLLASETRAGKARIEAFRNLAARTGVEDVRSLVAMLAQTDRFGTSVALALRTQADTCRTVRRQRAEERAAKIGVKLVFPLVLALFPAFFVVTLGPAVVMFIRVLTTHPPR